jgi:predicted MFS family arabinose efflux permease
MDPAWIATAFSAVNSIRVLFYLPQIVAVARSTDGARDIALSTWGMWALTNGLGAAYGALVVHDHLLAMSFALSLLACMATILLTVVQRLRWRRRLAALAPLARSRSAMPAAARAGCASSACRSRCAAAVSRSR